MTAVGKILIFFVLLLSVATSALMVYVYQARSNFKVVALKSASSALIAEAAYKAEKKLREDDQKIAEQRTSSLQKELRDTKETNDGQSKRIAEHMGVLAGKDASYASLLTTQQRLQEEIGRLSTEREDFNKKYTALQDTINTLTTKFGELQKVSAIADNKLRDAERRRETVTVELQKTVAELAAARAGGASAAASGSTRPTAVPAPANVRGEVVYVGTTGLVQVTVGADNNLQVGNELYVMRMLPTPTYLGTIKLTRVNPKEAVGQFTPASRNDKIQIKDEVRSSLNK